jgi:hypothetical protein
LSSTRDFDTQKSERPPQAPSEGAPDARTAKAFGKLTGYVARCGASAEKPTPLQTRGAKGKPNDEEWIGMKVADDKRSKASKLPQGSHAWKVVRKDSDSSDFASENESPSSSSSSSSSSGDEDDHVQACSSQPRGACETTADDNKNGGAQSGHSAVASERAEEDEATESSAEETEHLKTSGRHVTFKGAAEKASRQQVTFQRLAEEVPAQPPKQITVVPKRRAKAKRHGEKAKERVAEVKIRVVDPTEENALDVINMSRRWSDRSRARTLENLIDDDCYGCEVDDSS